MSTSDVPSDTEGAELNTKSNGPHSRPRFTLPHVNRAWAWLTTVAGAVIIGFAISQLLMPPSVTSERVASMPAPSSSATPTVGPVVMPNVLGLDSVSAQRVLLDAGVGAEITFDTRPAAGPEDVVVAQTPTTGEVVDGELRLTLSTAVTIPEVIGVSIGDARATLEELGAVVQVTRAVDPTSPEGSVLSIDPAVGQPVPAVVVIVVADPGEALSLTSLSPVDEEACGSVSSATLNGVVVQDSVRCSSNRDGPSFSDWVLARQASALEMTLGVADSGNKGTAHVRVLGDDAVLMDTDVTYGASSKASLDVRGVLRLRVEVTFADPKNSPTVVLGDARLLGTAEQLAAIEAAQ